ncbi:MAG: 5-oxoprolinase subunit PxpA [Maribacter sp.]
MKDYFIDINCDIGEGIGNEPDLLPLISSCNIACGGHAGNDNSIIECLKLAKKHNVLVGAHPAYPDRENFGRISMDISDSDLTDAIQAQLTNFISKCNTEQIKFHHIKPHGALYNDIAKDPKKAALFLKTISKFKSDIFLYLPYDSVVQKIAISEGFKVKREAFADRNYTSDLNLVSRKEDNALITDADDVLLHILSMVKDNLVHTVDGKTAPIFADTFCLHGDTPSAFQILTYITVHFPEHNIYTIK